MPGSAWKRFSRWQAFALVLLVGGTVFAQGAPAPAPPASEEQIRNAGRLSPEQQGQEAIKYLGQMRTIQTRVEQLREQALKSKDVIRLNCVNEKLTEIKGNINVGERAHNDMGRAGQDAPERTHQFTKVATIQQKVVILGQEAEQCVGEDIRYTGTTTVVTETPPGLPDDPTRVDPPQPFIPRPPDASVSQ
jgi:hypothetical protein